jgi:hypothetical protein
MKIVIVLCMVLFATYAESNEIESYHNELWCEKQGGEIGVVLKNRRICDCVTNDMLIETKLAKGNCFEALGKVLYLSMIAKKKAGLLLVVDNSREWTIVDRMQKVIVHYKLPVSLFYVESDSYKK